jgi:hypothetical protein
MVHIKYDQIYIFVSVILRRPKHLQSVQGNIVNTIMIVLHNSFVRVQKDDTYVPPPTLGGHLQ